MRYLAIPDLHGHYDELMELMTICVNEGFDPVKDTAVFLGDYVDGGLQTRQLLDTLIEWKQQYPHWVFLMGNHERMLLDAVKNGAGTWPWEGWYHQGGAETIHSYLDPVTGKNNGTLFYEHREWLARLNKYHVTDNHIFVHAGLRPPLPVEAQVEDDLLWIREEFIESNYDWGKRVVYGHTPTAVPRIERNKIGLDTKPREEGFICAALIDDSNQTNCHIFYPPKAEDVMKNRAKYVFDWPLSLDVDKDNAPWPLTGVD